MAKRRHKVRAKPEPLFSRIIESADSAFSSAPTAPKVIDTSAIPDVRPAAVRARVAAVDADPQPQRGARPHGPQGATAALRVAEMLALPAAPLHALPDSWTMLCEACLDADSCVLLVITTCAADYARSRGTGYVTLHGAEWTAVALAAELDRATPREMARWCELKQRDRSWELTPRTTLGTHIGRSDQKQLSVGRVLQACGAALLDVAAVSPAAPDFWEVTQ